MNAKAIFNAANLAVIATILALAGVTPIHADNSRSSSYIADDLPSMVVVKQWSNVRAMPEITGDIVVSLELGTQIRVLDIINKWILVRYDNGQQSATGFMHQSLLGYFNSGSIDVETEANFTNVKVVQLASTR